MLTFIISFLDVFIFSDYKNLYLPSILHLYHHLFAELVHLYNLPLYWVRWGHKRLFVIWLQGCLRETIFNLRLPQIDKPYVIHLREKCLFSYKTFRLEAQNESIRIKLHSRHHAFSECYSGGTVEQCMIWCITRSWGTHPRAARLLPGQPEPPQP